MAEGGITTVSALFTQIGGTVSTVTGWITDICGVIVNTPLLAMSLTFFAIGGVAGLIGRLLAKN